MSRLRIVLIGLAGVALVATAAAFVAGWGARALLPPAVWAAVLLAALVFERYRYKPLAAAPPGADWHDTGERFRDPRTGREVKVYSDPVTGARAYVSPPGGSSPHG